MASKKTLIRSVFREISPNIIGGVVVLGVALVGVLLLFVTKAAVQDGVTAEPENGAVTAPATVRDDAQASGGKAIQFSAPSSSGLLAIPRDCSVDVTTSLNAFVASQPDGSTIDFPINACYIINGTINLINRKNLTFNGNGSTFKQLVVPVAKVGVPQWKLTGGNNITVRNMIIQGVNKVGTYNGDHEWDHNIDIRGASNVTIDRVTGKNAGGDFVNIGPNTSVPLGPNGAGAIIPTTIRITNSSANITGRNGISCTGCEDVLVDQSSFSNIGYMGFDLEIEASTWYGRNIRVTNNTWKAVHLSVFAGSGSGLDTTDITVSGNLMTDRQTCQPPVNFNAATPRNNIIISGNTLLGYQLAIGVNRTKNLKITDNKIQVINGGCGGGSMTGVALTDVDGATLSGNDFTGSAMPFSAGTLTRVTNYIACSNKLPSSTAFNYPNICTAAP